MAAHSERGRTRRELLADAAIEVIAAEGLRGLTHRAVDDRAEVPAGTTSYNFRTRMALLQGVLDRIVELNEATLDALTAKWGLDAGLAPERVTEMMADLLEHWLGPARSQATARLEIYLDAMRRPELRPRLEAATRRFHTRVRRDFERVGLPQPGRDAHLFLALLDGVLYDALARPFLGEIDRAFLRHAAEVVLRGLALDGTR